MSTIMMAVQNWVLRKGVADLATLDLHLAQSGECVGGGWFHTRECHEAHRHSRPLNNWQWVNDIPMSLALIALEEANRTGGIPIGFCMMCTVHRQVS